MCGLWTGHMLEHVRAQYQVESPTIKWQASAIATDDRARFATQPLCEPGMELNAGPANLG